MDDLSKTPTRQKLTGSAQPTTSPYFSRPASTSSVERRRNDSPESQPTGYPTPDRVANLKHEMRLTTSPYSTDAQTSPWHVVQSSDIDIALGRETENETRQRKRTRLIVRGDAPEEHLPPPASPAELSRALRRVRPALIQEEVRDDPWKIIVATTLLNKTSGRAAVPIFWQLTKRWPTPIALVRAAAPSLTELLRPLGIQSVRTSRLIRLSNTYAMHPPVLPPPTGPTGESKSIPPGSCGEYNRDPAQISLSSPCSALSSDGRTHDIADNNKISLIPDKVPAPSSSPTFWPLQHETSPPTHTKSAKRYRATQKASAIAYLPFTGPYAIDSFRIFSSSLTGGAPSRVEEQLGRIARLSRSEQHPPVDDFDETPTWYDPTALHVCGDQDAEWRHVRPEDKELRRYLVWRWAIEGIAYRPEKQSYTPADWSYLNQLFRH